MIIIITPTYHMNCLTLVESVVGASKNMELESEKQLDWSDSGVNIFCVWSVVMSFSLAPLTVVM